MNSFADFLPYLIVCPLVFLAGLVDAIGGGGGLISLPAYLLAGIPPHAAIACNKFSSCLGTAFSTARFLRSGFVQLKIACPAAALALLGSAAGASLSLLVDEAVLQGVLLVVLPITAFFVLKNKNLGDNERTGTRPALWVWLISLAAAFFIGLYDGFYGPGTGTFLILIFAGLARLDLKTAAGNTKVINLASNVAALVVFLINGAVLFPLAAIAAVFSIAGHYTGAGLVLTNGRKIVRPIILLVLVLLLIKVVAALL
jgi:uncharacterized protein